MPQHGKKALGKCIMWRESEPVRHMKDVKIKCLMNCLKIIRKAK